ncbi:PIN domain-containing protein, partial [Xylophilus sp. Kf1]|nr:PIN domain-containing protein [Xylophilus sp. Kf1]
MRAVLDANVLFPTILREILTDLAQAGLYHALWSDRILEEWHRAAARIGPDAESVAGAQIALLRLRFPQAVQPDDGQAA